MKKLGILVAALALLVIAVPALAKRGKAPGHWELTAPTGIDLTCGGGTFRHTLDEITSDDPLMGIGHYNPNGAYTWDLTGDIDGNDVFFTIVYTGINSGYTLNLEGTIASDGSITGTSDGNCQTFAMGEGSAVWKGPAKVDVCHVKGNGSYHLINVSEKALPAHLAHGDGQVGGEVPDMGGYVFGEDCTPEEVVEPNRYQNTLGFNPTGWAGWSCPLTEYAVGAGVLVGTADTYLWGPGASAGGYDYPATPFGYTYNEAGGETGMIIQNDGDGNETITYYVDCLPK